MKPPSLRAGSEFAADGERLFVITVADYRRLLEASEGDDMIVRCEGCGAWLAIDDPACAPVQDVTGCWAYVTGREKDGDLCRRYRVCEDDNQPHPNT